MLCACVPSIFTTVSSKAFSALPPLALSRSIAAFHYDESKPSSGLPLYLLPWLNHWLRSHPSALSNMQTKILQTRPKYVSCRHYNTPFAWENMQNWWRSWSTRSSWRTQGRAISSYGPSWWGEMNKYGQKANSMSEHHSWALATFRAESRVWSLPVTNSDVSGSYPQ